MRLLLGCALLSLAACTSPSRYAWGGYSNSVSAITSGEGADVAKDIDKLTRTIEQARAEDLNVPPGMHAHMGMLYSLQGNLDLAVAALESEKELYPESAAFIDGVLARMGAGQ